MTHSKALSASPIAGLGLEVCAAFTRAGGARSAFRMRHSSPVAAPSACPLPVGCRAVPRHCELDFVGHGQYPLQVLGAKGAGLAEGDAGGQPLDDHRARIAFDPLVWHLDGVFDPQGFTWKRSKR